MKAELRPKPHNGTVVPGDMGSHSDDAYTITITLTPQNVGPHHNG